MTYIIPDDWYANGGKPPGVPWGRQPPIEPINGSAAPLPPMRGYFGVRPVRRTIKRTRAPYMLGALGDPIQDIMAGLQKDMKKIMIEQAAAVTGITISLNFIPVVGTAASIIFSVVQGLSGSKFQGEAQKVLADTKQQANQMAADFQLKIDTFQNKIFMEEKDSAIKLALSCSAEVAAVNGIGLGELGFSFRGFIKKLNPVRLVKVITRPVGRVIKSIAPDSVDRVIDKADRHIDRAKDDLDDKFDILSGEVVLIKAKDARKRVLAEVRNNFDQQYIKITTEMSSPEFRLNLQKSIAHSLLENSAIATLAKQKCGMSPRDAGDMRIKAPMFDTTTPKGMGMTGVAVAGVVAAIFIGMSE